MVALAERGRGCEGLSVDNLVNPLVRWIAGGLPDELVAVVIHHDEDLHVKCITTLVPPGVEPLIVQGRQSPGKGYSGPTSLRRYWLNPSRTECNRTRHGYVERIAMSPKSMLRYRAAVESLQLLRMAQSCLAAASETRSPLSRDLRSRLVGAQEAIALWDREVLLDLQDMYPIERMPKDGL